MANVKSCESRMADGVCMRAKNFGINEVYCNNYMCIMKQNTGNKTNNEKQRKQKNYLKWQ